MRGIHLVAASVAAFVIGGCSSKPTDLSAKTPAQVHTYTENYQEIYRRVSSTAKRCQSGGVGVSSSFVVDSELYPDLGYGEASFSLVSLGVRNYYWTAKIEKDGTGAKMTVNSGNTLSSGQMLKLLPRWAAGDEKCM